jgi:hypothetical protein
MPKIFPVARRAFQQLLWCALTAVALAGCGGEGGTPSNASAAAASSVPVVNGTPPTTAVAGEKYEYVPTVSNASGQTLAYEIVNKPAWASFDATNGELSGTPDADDVGLSAEIQINVSNGTASAIIGPFRIRISAHKGTTSSYSSDPGAAPTIAGTPQASVNAGQPYSFRPLVVNRGAVELTFAIANRPAWTTFNPANGALSGIPTTANEGTFANIQISVTGAGVTVSLPAFSIFVGAPASNSPTISGTPASWVEAGSRYSFTPVASDPQGLPLTFAIVNAPTWATFSASTGELSGTPASSDAGTWGNILISVSDGTQSASLPAFAIQVQTPSADTPSISGNPPTSIVAGDTYSFTPTASDPDGNALSFSVTNLPPWASFNTSSGQLSGTPADANAGSYADIVISVSNGSASASLAAFSIQVETPNLQPPVIGGKPPTSVVAGSGYAFTPTASDPQGKALTFSVKNLPSWASFSSSTGKLSGTPASANVGTYGNIVISVSDGSSSASLAPFSIAVTGPASGSATLNWSVPTENTNGTPLTNLAGFHIYYGASPSNLNNTAQIASADTTSYTVDNLAAGTWYFSINAYTSAGVESAISNIASTTIP